MAAKMNGSVTATTACLEGILLLTELLFKCLAQSLFQQLALYCVDQTSIVLFTSCVLCKELQDF